MSVPQASPIASVDSSVASSVDSSVASSDALDIHYILSALKHMNHTDLFRIIKTATSETEKRVKDSLKNSRINNTRIKKTGSAPKGVIPNQLKKNLAWVKYTLLHAINNGWEQFTIINTKKDKITGHKTSEEIVMPRAIQNSDGLWVYDGSITPLTPSGRQIIQKEAMTLSKIRKDTSHSTYAMFEGTYDEDSSTLTHNTAASKEAEKAAEKAAKKAAKEAEKAAKDAEKAAKKATKDAKKGAKASL